jgi:hypothetical protein
VHSPRGCYGDEVKAAREFLREFVGAHPETVKRYVSRSNRRLPTLPAYDPRYRVYECLDPKEHDVYGAYDRNEQHDVSGFERVAAAMMEAFERVDRARDERCR